ncbi:accessory factor UbiK family protein [Maricaulis sp.]|jgi:BMFP domain-containing protein YqiC|uniref:accessory factor UbiK family protein n=1 Tax=Maricaulis sp. TaxID=1486257 RepID=UPI0025D25952|nr:accessory factor UbiK family protein [Maricaulis sp.]MDF1769171.1 accessory factor UbiK family protein [Maricaulis sp.]
MQTRNPLLNDFADLMTDAFGAAQAMGEEARSVFRARADRMVAEMDLVTREEFDAVKAALDASQEEVSALTKRLEALEAAAKPKPAARKKATPAKPAASKAKTTKSATGKA